MAERLKLKIKGKDVSKNGRLFLLCIILSTILWFSNTLSEIFQTSIKIPISYQTDKKMMNFKYPLPTDLKVQLSSKGWDILKINNQIRTDSFLINLNKFDKSTIISNKELKEQMKLFFPSKVVVSFIEPDTIHLEEDVFEKKTVPLLSKIQVSTALGYGLYDNIHFSPSMIEISGPKSIISGIKYMETKDSVLNNVSTDTSFNIGIKINNKLNIKTNYRKIHVFLPISQLTEKFLRLPIKIENYSNTNLLNTVPGYVKIYYQVPLNLADLNQEDQFEVSIDFQKRNFLGEANIKISSKPPYVSKLRIEPMSVRVLELKSTVQK